MRVIVAMRNGEVNTYENVLDYYWEPSRQPKFFEMRIGDQVTAERRVMIAVDLIHDFEVEAS